jgi:hypothetical protein
MRAIKWSMDPKNIMNPGVLLPPVGFKGAKQVATIDREALVENVLHPGEITLALAKLQPPEAGKYVATDAKQVESPPQPNILARFWNKKPATVSPVTTVPVLATEPAKEEKVEGT